MKTAVQKEIERMEAVKQVVKVLTTDEVKKAKAKRRFAEVMAVLRAYNPDSFNRSFAEAKEQDAKRTKPWSFERWMKWIEGWSVECYACRGSGKYFWGTNAKKHGPCVRCAKKGKQTVDDHFRNAKYDANRKVV